LRHELPPGSLSGKQPSGPIKPNPTESDPIKPNQTE